MRVVVDANVLAAAAVRPGGWTARELARPGVDFFAPAFVGHELDEHESDLAMHAGCGVAEWRGRVRGLLRRVRMVRSHRLVRHSRDPLVLAMEALDPDDAPYVAALLECDADFLWTYDKAIKQLLQERAGPNLP